MSDVEQNKTKVQGSSDDELASIRESLNNDPLIGTELDGAYLVEELIGSGSYGNVYRGKHLSLGTDIAIKILQDHLIDDTESLKRFQQEAQLLSRIDSAHVVKLVDYGLEPAPYMIMEYFEGASLSFWLRQQGHLELEQSLQLFNQISEGLEKAHSLGLVHRDLKPANILVKLDKGLLRVKIIDFGIAKLASMDKAKSNFTVTGEVLGSPPYMAPEQWNGMAVDARTDIYALGCIMYETLSGKTVFKASTGFEFMNKHLNGEASFPPNPTDSRALSQKRRDLEAIILKCLRKDMDTRYATVTDFRQDLQRLDTGEKLDIQPLAKVSVQKGSGVVPRLAIVTLGLLLIASAAIWFERVALASHFCNEWNKHADQLSRAGQLDEAGNLYKQSISLSGFLNPQDKSILHAMRSLAKILKSRRLMSEADVLSKKQQELIGNFEWSALKTLDEQGKADLRFSFVKLATLNKHIKLQRREKLAQGAVNLAASKGKHTFSYAACVANLGNIYQLERKLDLALKSHAESVQILRDLLEPDDVSLAAVLGDLAADQIALGKFAEARSNFQEAFQINKTADPNSLPLNLGDLALVCDREGNSQEALRLFKQAIDMQLQTDAENFKAINALVDQMSLIYERDKKYQDCIDFCKELQATLRKKGLNAESPYRIIGICYFALKDYSRAESFLTTDVGMTKGYPPSLIVTLPLLIESRKALGKGSEVQDLEEMLAKAKTKVQDLPEPLRF